MPKWKHGSSEFTVNVSYSENRGYACTIPRPVIYAMDKPKKITFKLKGRKVQMESVEDGKT